MKLWDEFGTPLIDIKEKDPKKAKKKFDSLFNFKIGGGN